MEDSLENLISYLEMEDDILNESNSSFDEQEFLKEIILEQPDNQFGLSAVETTFSHAIENLKALHSTPSDSIQTGSPDDTSLECKLPCSKTIQQNNIVVEGCANSPTNSSNLSFDETIYDNNTLQKSNSSNPLLEMSAFSPTTCLLSFDNSSVDELVIHEPKSHNFPMGSKRKSMEKDGFETKKVRRSSTKTQTIDHLMAERKRRRELTESIIQLSSMIPGLKKMDKAYVLNEAVNYTKQLQKRVKDLENQNEDKRVNSAISIWKSQPSSNKSTKNTESMFEIEVRVLEKKVLIRILCEKQKDIMVKTHALLLEKFHLSITSSGILPFGTSTLAINIIAQMDGEHNMATDDLVRNLRECLLEAYENDMH